MGELDPSVPSPTLSMPLNSWYGIESSPLPTSFTFSDFLEPLWIHGLFAFRFNKVRGMVNQDAEMWHVQMLFKTPQHRDNVYLHLHQDHLELRHSTFSPVAVRDAVQFYYSWIDLDFLQFMFFIPLLELDRISLLTLAPPLMHSPLFIPTIETLESIAHWCRPHLKELQCAHLLESHCFPVRVSPMSPTLPLMDLYWITEAFLDTACMVIRHNVLKSQHKIPLCHFH